MSRAQPRGGSGGTWRLWLGVATALAFLGAAAPARAAPFVYVTNFQSPGSVSQYAIGTGGGLSPLSPATVGPIALPVNVAVTPNGKSAYVTRIGVSPRDVLQYDIDPLTGALSPKTPATVDAQEAWDVAVAPNGQSAYVVNTAVPPDSSGTISQYTIDPVDRRAVAQNPRERRRGRGAQLSI